jgi:hypothetical protein
MKRLWSFLLAFFLLSPLCGCGSQFFVRGAVNTATVSGTVSLVQLSSVASHGTFVTVTVVTFLQSGTSTNLNFCGDQRAQFPMERFVNASFTPGPVCGSILQIVIVI